MTAALSREYLIDYPARDIGQSEISSHVPVRETSVIEAQTMQYGSLQIVNMNGIFYDFQAEIVRPSNYLPSLHSTARHPYAETVRVMVAAGALVHLLKLAERGSAEFTAP